MGIVYILGAGFSKTCGIATDLEMLDSLNSMLKATAEESRGAPKTTIEHLREQNFRYQRKVSFEQFMSTLSSAKFLNEFMESDRNIFREAEQEIRKTLRTYLKSCVRKANWQIEGKAILDFTSRVDWKNDFVLTFNYDMLLEAAAKRLDLDVGGGGSYICMGRSTKELWLGRRIQNFRIEQQRRPSLHGGRKRSTYCAIN